MKASFALAKTVAAPRKLTRAQIAKLDPLALLMEVARVVVETHGSLTPPPETLFATTIQKCPHCGDVGRTMEKFGIRMVQGSPRAQSWCRACRNSPDSHPSRYGL